METLINSSIKFGNKITKLCALFFLFTATFASKVYAQADVNNIKKAFDAKRQADQQADHDAIISYIVMTVGFAIVIAVAWFSTSMAKKSRIKSDAAKAERASKMMAHGSHAHGHAHGAHRRR